MFGLNIFTFCSTLYLWITVFENSFYLNGVGTGTYQMRYRTTNHYIWNFPKPTPPLCNFGAFQRVKNNYFEFVAIKILVGLDHFYQTPYGCYTSLPVGLPQTCTIKNIEILYYSYRYSLFKEIEVRIIEDIKTTNLFFSYECVL